MSKKDPRKARQRKHSRLRRKVSGTAEHPRLYVFRSLRHIYAQLIDDEQGHTIVSASTLDPGIGSELEGKQKVSVAAFIGSLVARRAVERGIRVVVFDRGGYKYHGRVKVLADAAREGGLEF